MEHFWVNQGISTDGYVRFIKNISDNKIKVTIAKKYTSSEVKLEVFFTGDFAVDVIDRFKVGDKVYISNGLIYDVQVKQYSSKEIIQVIDYLVTNTQTVFLLQDNSLLIKL